MDIILFFIAGPSLRVPLGMDTVVASKSFFFVPGGSGGKGL